MFGWMHESVKQLIVRKYGKETWLKILTIANFEEGTESTINHYYKDEETYRLFNAIGGVVGIPVEEVWEAYGGFLIQFTMETGWDELLRALATDLKSFLDNLDALHYFIDHVVYKARLRGPSFRCDTNYDDGSITLHYYSKRSGLYPIVKGVIREISRRVFGMEIVMKVLERKQEHVEKDGMAALEEHVVFHIEEINRDTRQPTKFTHSTLNINNEYANKQLALTLRDFVAIFPHHLCFDHRLVIEHCGVYIKRLFPFLIRSETTLFDIVEMMHPEIPMNYDNFIHYINGTFVFKLKCFDKPQNDNSEGVFLKGQMVLLEDNEHIVYVCSLYVTTIRELLDRNLHLSDIPLHDATRDMILLNQSRLTQVEMNRKLEETTKELKKMAIELENEKGKTDSLLKELLPNSVVEQLRLGGTVEPENFSQSTIMFADIVNFNDVCTQCKPMELVQLLNDLYSNFDRLTMLNGVFKVVTIGDAYMVVGGVPEQCANHAERVCNLALGMLWECKCVSSSILREPLRIQIGINSGPVVGGVVGKKMVRYCLFGDTVTTASRIQSAGLPSRIHLSLSTFKAATNSNHGLVFEERGFIDIKGKGQMLTYFLLKNNKKSLWELINTLRKEENSIDGYKELHENQPQSDSFDNMSIDDLKSRPVNSSTSLKDFVSQHYLEDRFENDVQRGFHVVFKYDEKECDLCGSSKLCLLM